LGISDGASWEQQTVTLAPGESLLLYTDGVTDAKDSEDNFFGEQRLRGVLLGSHGQSAKGIQEQVLEEVHSYHGEEPQFDDITIAVIVRSDVN
jgi:sigma-B regulation protein RsbU (phosphoserine phosphatase)